MLVLLIGDNISIINNDMIANKKQLIENLNLTISTLEQSYVSILSDDTDSITTSDCLTDKPSFNPDSISNFTSTFVYKQKWHFIPDYHKLIKIDRLDNLLIFNYADKCKNAQQQPPRNIIEIPGAEKQEGDCKPYSWQHCNPAPFGKQHPSLLCPVQAHKPARFSKFNPERLANYSN